MENTQQTHTSFFDKWQNNKRDFYDDALNEKSEITQWILRRNGFADFTGLKTFLRSKKRILDAGCGNGRITNLMASLTPAEIVGVDFSAYDVARENLQSYPHVNIHQGDLTKNLSALGKFDFIYCQEVLHHTGAPAQSFYNLCEQLTSDGEIAIYVYRKKAPVREFVDDHIRVAIQNLDYEKATKACEAITQLGKTLHELNIQVNVPEIEALGIKAGQYPLQRFFYHHFMKCFWNPALTMKENVTINYDWYHPSDCTRHTVEEVEGWFKQAGLNVTKTKEDEYGITMWGERP